MKVFYKSIINEINELAIKYYKENGIHPTHAEITKGEWNLLKSELRKNGMIFENAPDFSRCMILGLLIEVK